MPILIQNKAYKNSLLTLTSGELLSIYYHDIFDYPLTQDELNKWSMNLLSITGKNINKEKIARTAISIKGNYIYLSGREENVVKRLMGGVASKRKMAIARKAAAVLSSVPTIRFVGVTGALAMENANEESDIDLLIISSKGTLWATRIVAYIVLKIKGFDLRRSGDSDEKDKLCLNIWLDERELAWDRKDRNAFTAHEIAQVVPLINKGSIYKRFINKNIWIRKFWPSAIGHVGKSKNTNSNANSVFSSLMRVFEPIARVAQYLYMKKKITREVVTPTRALFHPVEWSSVVEARMESIIENLYTGD